MDELDDYRKHLVLAEQKAQEDFDKTVMSLSGGALGISFAFIDKIVGTNPMISPSLLFYAWWSWGASVAIVLLSYLFSIRAIRRAIKQTDTGAIYIRRPGGKAALLTEISNLLGASLFFLGLFLIGLFIKRNLGV
jgi:hypothetical protein